MLRMRFLSSQGVFLGGVVLFRIDFTDKLVGVGLQFRHKLDIIG